MAQPNNQARRASTLALSSMVNMLEMAYQLQQTDGKEIEFGLATKELLERARDELAAIQTARSEQAGGDAGGGSGSLALELGVFVGEVYGLDVHGDQAAPLVEWTAAATDLPEGTKLYTSARIADLTATTPQPAEGVDLLRAGFVTALACWAGGVGGAAEIDGLRAFIAAHMAGLPKCSAKECIEACIGTFANPVAAPAATVQGAGQAVGEDEREVKPPLAYATAVDLYRAYKRRECKFNLHYHGREPRELTGMSLGEGCVWVQAGHMLPVHIRADGTSKDGPAIWLGQVALAANKEQQG